jgi:hypothetical protein
MMNPTYHKLEIGNKNVSGIAVPETPKCVRSEDLTPPRKIRPYIICVEISGHSDYYRANENV